MPKSKKPIPANLSRSQQQEMVKSILDNYPTLKGEFEDDVAFLVKKYSEDKRYLTMLEELTGNKAPEKQLPVSFAPIEVFHPGSPEHEEMVSRVFKVGASPHYPPWG